MSSPYSRQRFDPRHDSTRPSSASSHAYTLLLERFSPPILVAALVLLLTILFNLLRSGALAYQLQALAVFFWDCLVTVTPASVIAFVDSWVNPPMFPGLAPSPGPKTHAEKSEKMASLLGVNRAAGALRTSPPYLANALRSGTAKRKEIEAAKTLQDLIADLNDAENNGRTLWTPRVLKNMSSFVQQDAQEYYSKLLDEIDSEIAKSVKAAADTGGPTQQQGFGPSPPATDNTSRDDNTSQHSDDSGYGSAPCSVSSKISAASRVPRNPLEGLLAQRVACVQCGYSEGLSLIPFNCLTLNLGVNTPGHDLYERLDAYTDLESIEGVECPRCTLLKLQRLLGTLADRFRQTPHSEEHLARVEARLEAVNLALEEEDFTDETVKEKCKVTPESRVNVVKTKQANSAAVRFPTALDLGPWCLGSTTGRGRSAFEKPGADIDAASLGGEEKWILDPRVSMVAGENRKSAISGPIYELRAVVTHYGHHNNGHYICYRKHTAPAPAQPSEPKQGQYAASKLEEEEESGSSPLADEKASQTSASEQVDDRTWWRLSDESVYKVDEEMVTSQGGVFMLFYDCVDPALVRTDGELPETPIVARGDGKMEIIEGYGAGEDEGEDETLVGSQRSSNFASRAGSVDPGESIREVSPASTLVGRGESAEPVKWGEEGWAAGRGFVKEGTIEDAPASAAPASDALPERSSL
ncbi:unnamed protein product [Parascedosporium putredinis]|uniref:ubiquitinyl hydrolase 1 n=1 Tax=Parascedosporium putredinis TaxID=1442378 RepID=A0A9P1M702_9PEZI|nr:unnamed protein product [Parascedosporium putredinis]CAI7990688.1 unnamed protein product [Parascedosporium putredinis]